MCTRAQSFTDLSAALLDAAAGGITIQDCYVSGLLGHPIALGDDNNLYNGPQGGVCPPNGSEMPSDFVYSQPNQTFTLPEEPSNPAPAAEPESPNGYRLGDSPSASDPTYADAGDAQFGASDTEFA